jgi:hypothetical protein
MRAGLFAAYGPQISDTAPGKFGKELLSFKEVKKNERIL